VNEKKKSPLCGEVRAGKNSSPIENTGAVPLEELGPREHSARAYGVLITRESNGPLTKEEPEVLLTLNKEARGKQTDAEKCREKIIRISREKTKRD